MKPNEYSGRTVFVPGGSMGLGRAAAQRLAALGAHVVVFARRRQPLDAAAAAIAATRGAPRAIDGMMDREIRPAQRRVARASS